jgi:hypothetical protein
MTGVADLSKNRESVHAGHHHVEQDRVEAASRELTEPRLAAAGMDERHTLRLQIANQQLGQSGVVIDQEHAHDGIISHAVGATSAAPRSAATEPVAVEQLGELIALVVVEYGVDVAQRLDRGCPRVCRCTVDTAEHGAECGVIERGATHGSVDFAPWSRS